MLDLRVTQAKIFLPVASYTPVRGFRPPSILILGTGLDKADEILFNGVDVQEFVILSSTRVIARIPDNQVNQPLTSIQILATTGIQAKNALLDLKLVSGALSGIERLVQSFMILLLSTPGSDIFVPDSGGGVVAMVGRSTDQSGKGVSADLASAVDKSKVELVRLQSTDGRIPPDEKLLSATIASISFDAASTSISATVELKNFVGQTASVTVSG